MEFINRKQQARLKESLKPQKVLLLLGARRVGKTVLLNKLKAQIKESILFLNGENISTTELLARRSIRHYQNLLEGKKILMIDEAQKIPEIGAILKLMIDSIPNLKIVVTGSSAFNISQLMGEPLTGRKITLNLYPLAEEELLEIENITERKDNLNQRLVYGNYPELWQKETKEEKQHYLQELLSSYLMKDILSFEKVRNAPQLFNLLRLIAHQLGSEVSYNELARQLGMSVDSVMKYLDLLAKVFILFPIGGFSKNLRKEVVKSSKWYFYDNGIRNAIISNFNPQEFRNDHGPLWENYVISERIKYLHYHRVSCNYFFWRTYDQQEIDWIEERGGRLYGYEMKWNPHKKAKWPVAWKKGYPDATFEVITPDNYLNWVTADGKIDSR